MEKKKKTISFEIKEIDNEDRSFLAVGSTEDVDRDFDRIIAAGWDLENFKRNPVIPWAHKYGDPPVAQAKEIYVDDDRLMFRPKFATLTEYPFADTIYNLYKGGYLRSFSVGFMPKRYQIVERAYKRLGYDYLEQELWEISACTVPSNPNALVSAKSNGVLTEADYERLSVETLPDVIYRLNAIEKNLSGIGAMISGVPDFPDGFVPLTITQIEEKLLQLADGLRQSEKPEPGTENMKLDEKAITSIVKTAFARSAAAVGDIVDKRIKYHLGKVD